MNIIIAIMVDILFSKTLDEFQELGKTDSSNTNEEIQS